MTIAAQHVRSALNQLRGSQPAWRSILKSVGPFTVRVEQQPAWWLAQHLHCQNFVEFWKLQKSPLSHVLQPDPSRQALSMASWSEPQRNFWAELQVAQEQGRIDLSVPISTSEWTERTAALTRLLEPFQSTILDRFQFYCWGLLDSWPSSDPHLTYIVAKFLSDETQNSPASLVTTAQRFAATSAWAPYRGVAAWYLERWAVQRDFAPEL